jgi:hypothetical protein
MQVTLNFLKNKNACRLGINAFEFEFGKSAELKNVINFCIKSKKMENLSYANWLITKKMTKLQCVRYAIYAAEQVLSIFESKYPNDERPRKAIIAAKNYLKNPNQKDVADAAYADAAADAAAYAAADAAAADAAYAAADAAADAAAYAAADAAAADAAYAAADAAYAYAAADAAYAAAAIKMKIKILKYGLRIIHEKEK